MSNSTGVVIRCLGLLGGLSSEASAIYARFIHDEVRARCGGNHSGNLRIAVLNQHELSLAHTRKEWGWIGRQLEVVAGALVQAGAEALLFDSSTLHVVARSVETAAGVRLLHCVPVCARALQANRISCTGLLGTRCSEEEEIWRDWLLKHVGIDVVLPHRPDRQRIVEIMDAELAFGRIKEPSRVTMIRSMKALKRSGAQAVVVVAPELLTIVFPTDTALGFYGAPRLHARAAVEWALTGMSQAL